MVGDPKAPDERFCSKTRAAGSEGRSLMKKKHGIAMTCRDEIVNWVFVCISIEQNGNYLCFHEMSSYYKHTCSMFVRSQDVDARNCCSKFECFQSWFGRCSRGPELAKGWCQNDVKAICFGVQQGM